MRRAAARNFKDKIKGVRDARVSSTDAVVKNWPKSHGSRKRRESRLLFKAVTQNTVHVLQKCQIWVLKNVVSFDNGHEGKS